jgi:hypothetical protein
MGYLQSEVVLFTDCLFELLSGLITFKVSSDELGLDLFVLLTDLFILALEVVGLTLALNELLIQESCLCTVLICLGV